MQRQKLTLLLSGVFLIPIFLFGFLNSNTNPEVSAQATSGDGDVVDVVDAFSRINSHGVKLASHRGENLSSGVYDGNPGSDHFQGIQRLNENYLALTGASKELGSQLILIKLGSKEGIGNENFRSNMLNSTNVLGEVPTLPDSTDKVVQVINIDADYFHAGGIGIDGNILAIPLESKSGESKVVFYEFTGTQLQPLPAETVLYRTFSDTFIYNESGAEGKYTNKAGVTFLEQLPDGRYLLGVWSDSDSLLRVSDGEKESGFDIRRLTLYYSQTPGLIDFDSNNYVNLCGSVSADGEADSKYVRYQQSILNSTTSESHNCSLRNLNFPKPSFQALNLISEDDNNDVDSDRQMYLVSTYNTDIEILGILDSYHLTTNGIGIGEDRAVLWSLEFPLNGTQRDYNALPSIDNLNERHFHCDNGVGPHPAVGAKDYCNFQAAASIFVNNDRDISMYSSDYYFEWDGNLITFQEFRSLPDYDESINDVTKSWVELYEGEDASPSSRSWMIDYIDYEKVNYRSLSYVDNIFGVYSAIYQIPSDFQYLMFEQANSKGKMFKLEGTGHVELVNIENISVNSSGIAVNENLEVPVSGSEVFIRKNITDPSEGWIELFEGVNFDSDRLRIEGSSQDTSIPDYRSIIDGNNVYYDGEGSNFNDKVWTYRYQLPEGSIYRLYKNINYNGIYYDIVGTGEVEEGMIFDSDYGRKISSSKFFIPNEKPDAIATVTPASANRNHTVTLDGSMSTDPDGDILTYQWTQTSGTQVELENANNAIATFHAPTLTANERLVFRLTVNDGKEGTDFVNKGITIVRNRAPILTNETRAPIKILENSVYDFTFLARDADADELIFELTELTGDSSMSIESTGNFYWRTPYVSEPTVFVAEVKVSDNQGLFDIYQWQITVNPNTPPVIFNKINAPVRIAENKLYRYNVNAMDADRDTLVYSLLAYPDGMNINAANGLIEWQTPDVQATRIYDAQVLVEDGRGGSDTHNWRISVIPVGAGRNIAPRILNKQQAPTTILENQQYNFQVFGEDDNADMILFKLIQAPLGMTINSYTGEIDWTVPEFVDNGSNSYIVEVSIEDGRNGLDSDLWTINVENEPEFLPPVIDSNPQTSVVMKTQYQYPILAEDPEGGELFYSLVSGPSGMTLVGGTVRWTPTTEHAHPTCGTMTYPVTIRVRDIDNMTTDQSFDLGVRCPYGLKRVDTNITISGPKSIPRMFDNLWQWPNAYVIHYVVNTPITFIMEFDNPVKLTGFKVHSATHWIVKSANSWTGSRTTLISDGQQVSNVSDFKQLNFPEKTASVFEVTFIRREGDGIVHAAEIEPVFSSNNATIQINNVPNQLLSVGMPWAKNVGATYVSSIPDVLFCSLVSGPNINVSSGLVLSETCKLTWTPQEGDQGGHTVTLKVVDSRGNEDTETFSIIVE